MEYHLTTPLNKDDIKRLNAGDVVFITGTFITARDKAHMRMNEYFSSGKPIPFEIEGSVIFHGAPIVKKEGDEWKMVAIGPTTSARMNDQQPGVLKHGAGAIVGKGGMDSATLKALHENGSVYLAMTGGTAVLGSRMVEKIKGVEWTDLGLAEAVWILEVKDFGPLTVTMDSHMHDLYEDVRKQVSENVKSMQRET